MENLAIDWFWTPRRFYVEDGVTYELVHTPEYEALLAKILADAEQSRPAPSVFGAQLQCPK